MCCAGGMVGWTVLGVSSSGSITMMVTPVFRGLPVIQSGQDNGAWAGCQCGNIDDGVAVTWCQCCSCLAAEHSDAAHGVAFMQVCGRDKNELGLADSRVQHVLWLLAVQHEVVYHCMTHSGSNLS